MFAPGTYAFLAMNAKALWYVHSPVNVAVYHAGDIAGVGTSHDSAMLVSVVATAMGALVLGSHARLAARA